jgi:hypothetical protein
MCRAVSDNYGFYHLVFPYPSGAQTGTVAPVSPTVIVFGQPGPDNPPRQIEISVQDVELGLKLRIDE